MNLRRREDQLERGRRILVVLFLLGYIAVAMLMQG